MLSVSALLLCAGIFSCSDNQVPPAPGELVDVVIEVERNEFEGAQTRLYVREGGFTSWSPGDDVIMIDHGEGNYGQLFSYTLLDDHPSGAFSGKLLGGMGERTYHAYHMPEETDGFHEENFVLTIGRHDMVIYENAQRFIHVYGKHCVMVAVPKTFDVEDPAADMKLQFHHVNSLVEGRVTCSSEQMINMVFDTVEFRLTADGDTKPFSTEVKVDLTQIKGDGKLAELPFIDNDATKVNTIYTWIRYDNPQTMSNFVNKEHTAYTIPIFALPTTTEFNCTASMTFWFEGEIICKLEMHSTQTAKGLNPASLNSVSFSEDNKVEDE